MSLSSIKIKIRKLLPASIFDFGLSVWRSSIQKMLFLFERIRLRSFSQQQIVQLSYQGIAFPIKIDPVNGFIDEFIYLHGVYEDFILSLILNYLPKDGVFLDIGTNIGQHALFAAKYLNGQGHVYAFEPVPHLFKQFTDSLKIGEFKNITAYDFALGNVESEGKIYTNKENAGKSSLVNAEQPDQVLSVGIKKLDDVISTDTKVDMIKIDVEGYEYEVLSGGKDLIFNSKPVIILEFSPSFYKFKNSDISAKLLDFLLPLYNIIDIDDGNNAVKNKDEFLEDFIDRNRKQTNLLCLPIK